MKKSISMKLIEVYLIFALVVITYSSAIPKPGEDKKNRVHEQVMLLTSTLRHYLYRSMSNIKQLFYHFLYLPKFFKTSHMHSVLRKILLMGRNKKKSL